MELSQLRTFVAVADARSFTKAARQLFVSHSTVSRAVTALEDELGVCLIERDNKVFGLTEKGELLYEKARQILSLAEKTAEEIMEK